jgi:ABC-type transport system substrate-binding protein
MEKLISIDSLGRTVLRTASRGVLSPSSNGYNPELKGYPHDPARSRELLNEARLPTGLGPVEFWCTDSEAKMAQFIQQDLAHVGIQITVRATTQAARDVAVSTR